MSSETTGEMFKDRRGGLIFMGVLQIVIGAVCALLVPLMLLSLFVARKGDPDAVGAPVAAMVTPVLVYGFGAAFFISMGIGSIRARRWCRAIMTVVSWIWLIVGLQALLLWILMIPTLREQMASSPVPPGSTFIRFFVMFVGAVLGVLYIVLPALFAAFYSGRNVKATCEYYDPQPRWTDRCPLPVLAVIVLLMYGMVSLPMMLAYGVVPFFGILVTGVPAVIVLLAGIALLFVVVRWVYRLSVAGWWGAVGLTTFGALSYCITFARVDTEAFLRTMGFTAKQLKDIDRFTFLQGPVAVVGWVLSVALVLLYLLYARKFFKSSGTV